MKHILIISFLTLILVSCGITDFEMPSWDVELTSIPLMNEDFPASDLEGENIIIDDGELIATVEDQLIEATPELSKTITDSTPNLPVLSNIPLDLRFEIQSINTDTSFRIIEGTFDSGEMIIDFTGDVNDFQVLNVKFNQLITEAGDIYILALEPEDFIDNQYSIDLSGISLTDQDISGEFWLIDIEILAQTSGADGAPVGSVKLSIDDEIYFKDFTGFINDIQTLDSETDVEIDYPTDIEQTIVLEEISMYFDIYNMIGFNFELMGDLVAYRNGVEIDRISLEDEFPAGYFTIQAGLAEGVETLTSIEIIDNEHINSMLRKMPDNIAFLNPIYKVSNLDSDVPGFVSKTHAIRCDYRIEIPLKATFYDDYLIYPDNVHEVEISQDNQDLIEERVNSAIIEITLQNDFPIGGILDIYVSSQELEADSLSLQQAEIKKEGYDILVTSEEQSFEIELSKEDLNLFLRDKVFMRTRVQFHNSDGVVAILVQDNLNVKGRLKISLNIEGD